MDPKPALDFLAYAITICTIIGAAWRTIAFLRRRRVLRMLVGSDHDIDVWIPGRAAGRRNTLVASEDLQCALELAAWLRRCGSKARIRTIRPEGGLRLEDRASIVVCGPASNQAVARIIEQDDVRSFAMDHEVERWFVGVGDRRFTSGIDAEPSIHEDAAWMGVVPRSDSDPRSILVIAGIHAIGSLGAVRHLVAAGGARALAKAARESGYASMIVRAGFDDDPPTISSVGPIDGPSPILEKASL